MNQENDYRILVINPTSTATKIGIFDNELPVFEKTICHDPEMIQQFSGVFSQYEYRKQAVLETLDYEGINLSKLDAVCGRGGLLRPIEGGTYLVNRAMLNDLEIGYAGQHVSNLGGIISFEIASGLNIPAFIVDPVVVDELEPISRISGLPEIERKSIFHALNQKAAARRVAKQFNKKYEDLNFIVTHMGGGITIGAHMQGRVVDVNNGLHGEGPFTSERAGTLPVGDLVDLCFFRDFSREEIMNKLVHSGGLKGYLGTNDVEEAERLIKSGDEYAKLIYKAMAYQIAKEIGSASVVLSGKVDAIILTGDLAFRQGLVAEISERINWIADIIVEPGENQLKSLAEGALRILRGEELAKDYPGELITTTI